MLAPSLLRYAVKLAWKGPIEVDTTCHPPVSRAF